MLRSGHPDKFVAVYDTRRQRVRGLWRRGKRYYAQMRIHSGNGASKPKRIPLEAETLDQARAELEAKRTENRRGQLYAPGRRPKFEALVAAYASSAEFSGKRLSTRRRERLSLRRWGLEIGSLRCDGIKPAHLQAFRDRRLAQGVKAQTVNLDLIAFGNALRYGLDRGWVAAVPRVKPLKAQPPARRRLLTSADIGRLLGHCRGQVIKNAALLGFYLRFLALTGCREKEALVVRWEDVDFENRQVVIGADGKAKNSRHRSVNFSPELATLLAEMRAGQPPDSAYLFPSPQRGAQDLPAGSLRESLHRAATAAGLPRVGFHDFRHFFTSRAVMAGIDFLTIATWLGHQDGGVLIGKVYGHLSDSHKERMAANLAILKGL